MANNQLNRYIWIIDTIKRYGHITLADLNQRWLKNPLSDGKAITRRTFYNDRCAISDLFQTTIICDPTTFRYHIEDNNSQNESVTSWLLNSAALNNVLSDAQTVYNRIFLEEVPSAREHLGVIIDAVKDPRQIIFDYLPYTRINPTTDVVLEPYLLKIFKQRWYVTGRNVNEDRIKTYALDRMSQVKVSSEAFTFPSDFNPATYFHDSFGIVVDQSDVKKVAIRTNPRQAKYFRALPLHHSQQEVLHDDFSIFYLRIRITQDFVQELLSYGEQITVLEPQELRLMMISRLKAALDNYYKPQ